MSAAADARGRRAAPVIAALLAAGLLAGCQTKPSAPPILAVEAADCTASPRTAGAKPLAMTPAGSGPGSFDPAEPLEVVIDRSSRCLDLGAAGRSLYDVVALPAAEPRYVVRVAAEPSDSGIFAPHLILLDADGAALREIDQDSFLFRGRKLTAQFWAQPMERFLVIASNPESVGTSIQRVTSTTDMIAGVTPTASFILTSGSDRHSYLTYSHGGVVTLHALPPGGQ